MLSTKAENQKGPFVKDDACPYGEAESVIRVNSLDNMC